jgi:hypothetical protein
MSMSVFVFVFMFEFFFAMIIIYKKNIQDMEAGTDIATKLTLTTTLTWTQTGTLYLDNFNEQLVKIQEP